MLIVRPMIWRELLRESRHATHFGGRILIAIVLGVIVLCFGLSLNAFAQSSGATVQAMMANLGTCLFTVWAVGQYIALCALGTIRAASLAQERRADRLPLLTITRLGARGIILGTYASILVRALFTMLLLLPILALARGFGGFTAEQMCLAAGIAFIAAAQAAALTLALASLVRGTAAAVVLSAVVQGILLAISMVWFSQANAAIIHSLRLLINLVQGSSPTWDELTFYAVVRLLLCWAFLRLAMALMQRPAANPGRHLKRALTAMDQHFLKFAGRDKWVLWKAGLGECRGNPIYWRERAISVIGQRDHMIRVLYGTGILLSVVVAGALIVGWSEAGEAMAVIGVIGVPLLIGALLMLVQPALAFAREKERGGLDTLVLTPMTPRQFVMGKYWYALRSVAAPLAVGLGFAALLGGVAFVEGFRDETWFFVSLVLIAPLAVAVILHVAAGARSSAAGIFGGVAALAGLAFLFVELVKYEELRLGSAHSYLPLNYMLPRHVLLNYSGASGCCAFLLLLCSFLAAPYSKWMRNGLVIALFVLGPAMLSDFSEQSLPSSLILAIPVTLGIYMGIRLKALRVVLVPVAAAIPLFFLGTHDHGHSLEMWMLGAAILIYAVIRIFMRIGLARDRIALWAGAVILAFVALIYAERGHIPVFFLFLMLMLAYGQAARYADAGVFNRAFVAVALVGISVNFPAISLDFSQSAILFLIPLIVGEVIVFLSFTIRQFDQLVERNG